MNLKQPLFIRLTKLMCLYQAYQIKYPIDYFFKPIPQVKKSKMKGLHFSRKMLNSKVTLSCNYVRTCGR